jgi:predicted nuclease of predicted toxin-antitoxin system
MKLLFDQNISFRVIKGINDIFPEAKQLRELNLENLSDLEIWHFALKNDYAIVTFDADFYDMSLLHGIPPQIIWLRTGNTSTQNLIKIFRKNYSVIEDFISNVNYEEIACLEID